MRLLQLSACSVFCLVLLSCLAGAAGLAPEAVPPQLRNLSREYLEEGRAEARDGLLAFAGNAPSDEARAWAHLVAGVGDFRDRRFEEAAGQLRLANEGGGLFEDYAVYHRGRSLSQAGRFLDAAEVLSGFAARFPRSILKARALRLEAECLIRADRLAAARKKIEASEPHVPVHIRRFLLARIIEREDKPLEAVRAYRWVYYHYPHSTEADEAERALNGLRARLGKRYPDAPAAWRLKRAGALYRAGVYHKAGPEYRRAVAAGLEGEELDRARVRIGSSDYHRLRTSAAYRRLSRLKVQTGSADAERLYYLSQCARRLRRLTEFSGRVEELGKKYPRSPWFEEALFSRGNYFLLENDTARYRQYYERSFQQFPKGKHAAKAHWKVCWRAFLDDDPRTRSLFTEHVRLYPASTQASAAIYWLGRLLEKDGDEAAPRAYYRFIAEKYPHYYYAYLARKRLSEIGEGPEAEVPEFFRRVPPPRQVEASPSEETRRLLTRGRLLHELSLFDFAKEELTSANYREKDSFLVGLELARQYYERDRYGRGLRYLKRYGYGYLRMPFESMPRVFWERLYPFPWADRLHRRAAPHDLDPYLVAGLIRQESEFNASARSRAGALGLMQIMPATGRRLARRLGLSRYSTRLLYRPDVSLRLGTRYLKDLWERFDGNVEYVLAGYNAGEHRVDEWKTWGEFDEPGVFVETIPFTETRGYVQGVLRNAAVYRLLYGQEEERERSLAAAAAVNRSR